MTHGQNRRRITLITAFLVIFSLAVYFSLKCDTAGIIISTLGSIASLYAIIEAITKV